jgi:galactokinase
MRHPPTLSEQVAAASARFERAFGGKPTLAAAAPGRVNLIGEHTDYNDGFVLPMAIAHQAVVVAAPSDAGGKRVRLASTAFDGIAQFSADGSLQRGEPKWSNYIRGVVAGFLARGVAVPGFDAVIDSSVPVGGGLSSSAAIEVSAATLLEMLTGVNLGGVAKALLAQKAEHEYAGMPCGIMDQFISAMGQEGHALLIDCRSHETQAVPLDDPGVTVLIINTNVKHELTGGEYAQRRAQCEAAAAALGVKALRDATLEQLEAAHGRLDALVFARAHHIITENTRTLAAADALRRRDWSAVGKLMYASHRSMQHDFAISCSELDVLVDLAQGLGEKEGVIGSRMTGGGFGGCTVSLVRAGQLQPVADALAQGYRQRTGIEPSLFVSRPGPGARSVSLNA